VTEVPSWVREKKKARREVGLVKKISGEYRKEKKKKSNFETIRNSALKRGGKGYLGEKNQKKKGKITTHGGKSCPFPKKRDLAMKRKKPTGKTLKKKSSNKREKKFNWHLIGPGKRGSRIQKVDQTRKEGGARLLRWEKKIFHSRRTLQKKIKKGENILSKRDEKKERLLSTKGGKAQSRRLERGSPMTTTVFGLVRKRGKRCANGGGGAN